MEMVVLNTSETVSDLLDQRSAIYSDKVKVSASHALDFSQAPSVSSQATPSNARIVSLLVRWRLIDFGLMWPLRDVTGWEPLNPL